MFSERLERLIPYVPGEQPRDRRYVKLNTNENPYPPSPKVREVLREYSCERFRLYPDPLCGELRRVAARRYSIEPSNVFAGNGSDEVLSFAFFAFFERAMAHANPSYSFYPVYCNFYGIRNVAVPLDDELRISLRALSEAGSVDGVVIANPNSPTGSYIERNDIVAFLSRYPDDRVVILDEAYIGFGGESCVALIRRFPNLLVVQTFSKSSSLAGLRLGLAYGDSKLIGALFRTKDAFNSYPVDDLAQRIGVAAMEDREYEQAICRRIVSTRERTARRLAGVGWTVVPSRANFLFARHPRVAGGEVYRILRERGILVRHFAGCRLSDYVRITIGTDEEMDRFLKEAGREEFC